MALLILTEREAKEARLALYYHDYLNHGTAGHNRLILLAKLLITQDVRLSVTDKFTLINTEGNLEIVPDK